MTPLSNIRLTFLLFILFAVNIANGQNPPPSMEILRDRLTQQIAPFKATVGISLINIEEKDTLNINNHLYYPMQSVYKFHEALAILHEVDKGRLTLDQKIFISKKDLDKETWSPMRDKYPNGNMELTLQEILMYSVSYSDNNACDILFKLLKGPKAVENYMRSIGVTDVDIRATEAEMHRTYSAMFTNRTLPSSCSQLLNRLYHYSLLSDSSTRFLLRLMTASFNPAARIKGQLPEGTIVAHKTGSSGHNDKGVAAATNDIGIITLPNGQHIVIAVLVADSREDQATNEGIIAAISKTVYDFYTATRVCNMTRAELFDTARNRKIPVVVYRNANPDISNHKVAIISHGYMGTPDAYGFIARQLVYAGYLVISVGHEQPDDPPVATDGDIFKNRYPVWQRGIANIAYVCKAFRITDGDRHFDQPVLIGHSMGGDISMLMSTLYPEKVAAVITLDHRRVPIPRVTTPRFLSFRATDFQADPGVLPDAKDQAAYGIKIIELGHGALHNDLWDGANDLIKLQILEGIQEFIARE